MFRWPKDDLEQNVSFYQKAYRESMTTEFPNEWSLRLMKGSLFRDTEKDFASKLSLLKMLVPSGRVLDFGSSWGYGTFQLMAMGYEAIGFEISRPRAEFARRFMGVQTIDETSELDQCEQSFDAIFASHVLEHLSSLKNTFERFSKLLRPGGLLLVFVPNCDGTSARRFGVNWGPMCCEKHTIAFDATFFLRNLPDYGFETLSFSDPYPLVLKTQTGTRQVFEKSCDGDELVICGWRSEDGLAKQRGQSLVSVAPE